MSMFTYVSFFQSTDKMNSITVVNLVTMKHSSKTCYLYLTQSVQHLLMKYYST